jgi:hypothetical protein
MKLSDDLLLFLLRGKQNTYASGAKPGPASRIHSHDLSYQEGDFLYFDTYLGGFHFIGEEAVWQKEIPLWGMNYYGKMLVSEIPAGFFEFLKSMLMKVDEKHPFRGPAVGNEGSFSYHCQWQGNLQGFIGDEMISYKEEIIYRLEFHGGEIKD